MTSAPIADLSTAEKAALGSGADFWTTKAIGPVGSVTMTDGPHGVRRQVGATDHLGLAESVPATCFPPAVGLAQSWDADLVRRCWWRGVNRIGGERCPRGMPRSCCCWIGVVRRG